MSDTAVTIIGGGIVGLATARALQRRLGTGDITLVEKEPQLTAHQTGRNSGVIHSGVYYDPGSLKARLVADGRRELISLCRDHDIEIRWCGKLIVARDDSEIPGLRQIEARATAQGIDTELVAGAAIARFEPHAVGRAALSVPLAGVVDYRRVGAAMAAEITDAGGTIRLGETVTDINDHRSRVEVVTATGNSWTADRIVNCAGLHSDRIAALTGRRPDVAIVPFRGEYYELGAPAAELVHHLIYPVPDPRFPFLGVHLTRGVDHVVHAGPNAVLAMAREGYDRTSFDRADVRELATNPGVRRLAATHWRRGTGEMVRSVVGRAFLAEVRRLVPEIGWRDISRSPSGVRAQALRRDGTLVDDFEFAVDGRVTHVINAPSPAATASCAIGNAIAQLVVRHQKVDEDPGG